MELKETFASRTVDTSRKLNTPARDATDRLFSDRKEIPEKYRPERREEPDPAGKSGKKSVKKSSGKQTTRQKPETAPQKQEGRQKPAAQKQAGGKSNPQKQSGGKQNRQQQPAKSAAAQKQVSGNKSRRHPASQGKKIPPRTERPERQKDSTEQKSLMKPYYLSDRRKG